MVLMSLVLLGAPSGRALGLDTLLRRAARPAKERGRLLARLLYLAS